MPAEFPSIPYAGPAKARYGSYTKRYLVVHCTANDAPPASEAAYARTRTDGVGMHFCSDPAVVLQVLESWYGTGHVGSTVGNQYGISWEFVGYLTSSTTYYQACIDRAAESMRTVMAKWGIPHRWLTDAQLRDGHSKGLVTHAQCSRVLGGSDHTDPGPNFDQQYLIDALNGDTMSIWVEQQSAAVAHLLDAFQHVGTTDDGKPVPLTEAVTATRDGVAELLARPPVAIDPAQLQAAVTAALQDPAVLAALKPVIVAAVNEAEDS